MTLNYRYIERQISYSKIKTGFVHITLYSVAMSPGFPPPFRYIMQLNYWGGAWEQGYCNALSMRLLTCWISRAFSYLVSGDLNATLFIHVLCDFQCAYWYGISLDYGS